MSFDHEFHYQFGMRDKNRNFAPQYQLCSHVYNRFVDALRKAHILSVTLFVMYPVIRGTLRGAGLQAGSALQSYRDGL
jgi:hypothetical protein